MVNFEYVPRASATPPPLNPQCQLLLNSPDLKLPLTPRADQSQRAGVQVRFDFTLIRLQEGWIQLTTPLGREVVSFSQYRAIFEQVTLPYGQHLIRADGIGKTGRLCSLEFVTSLTSP